MSSHDFLKQYVDLQNKFKLKIDKNKSSDEFVVIRSTMSNGEEMEDFVQLYSAVSNTNWIVYRYAKALNRWEYSKTWKCHHSNFRKTTGSVRNVQCNARISVMIKKINRNTKKNDEYLCMSPAYPTEIKINLVHSHHTDVADSLKFLRVTDEVRQQFFNYFSDGLTPIDAKGFHERSIMLNENCILDLENAAKNPTQRQVYYLYNMWLANNFVMCK